MEVEVVVTPNAIERHFRQSVKLEELDPKQNQRIGKMSDADISIVCMHGEWMGRFNW